MALGFRTRKVPHKLTVSTLGSCALCIVCLERDTPAAAIISLAFGLDGVFVVASSRPRRSAPVKVLWLGSKSSDGIYGIRSLRRDGGTLNLRV